MSLSPATSVRALASVLTGLGLGMVLLGTPAAAISKTARQASGVQFKDTGSGETPAARRQRLMRECKGRPNAGACLGMTGRS